MVTSKKVEVNSLQDQCSEKDRLILDFEAQVSDLNNKLSAISNSAQDETKMLTAKIDKMSHESEDLRNKKREIESSLRKLENEMESVSQNNSELSIRIIEKEQQYKEVRSQVESMRMTYEKHHKVSFIYYVSSTCKYGTKKPTLFFSKTFFRQNNFFYILTKFSCCSLKFLVHKEDKKCSKNL